MLADTWPLPRAGARALAPSPRPGPRTVHHHHSGREGGRGFQRRAAHHDEAGSRAPSDADGAIVAALTEVVAEYAEESA